MTGTIQGYDAILSINKNGYLPFVCGTDVSVAMTSDELPIRTAKQGHWKNSTYNNASYSITLSGLLKFDDSNFSAFDMIDNWLGFESIEFRVSFSDENGNIKSLQGEAMVKSNTLSWSAGTLVKTDLELTGKGELKYFDGLIACDSSITGITITGQTAVDGIIHVNYTYSGLPYQVKYQIDGMGAWHYALLGVTLDIPGLSLGTHSINIVPVCQNGYESDNSASQAFTITRGLTCSAVCTSISTSGGSLTPVFTGSPAQWQYSIDGGPFIVVPISITSISISGLTVGAHTVSVQPICSNGAFGTGIFNQVFTVSSSPTHSIINWNTLQDPGTGNQFTIYVNGVLTVSSSLSSDSGSITVATGSTIIASIKSNVAAGARQLELKVTDSTLSSVLSDVFLSSPGTLNYTFTANGDTFLINGIISP
jgi:hypothetical protein